MATKIIYFVRHGQTEANAGGVRQGEGGPLSQKGKEQALETAKRFPKHKGCPEIIYASPFERTKETAGIIAKELNIKKIIYTDLLKERKNPTEIIGHWGGEPDIKRMIDHMDVSYHADDLRVSDEENFTDLKKRAKKLLYYISTRYHKRIIMVTHKIFLKMVIAYMLHGEKLTASEYNSLSYFNPIDNAGMAICTYKHHWFKPNEWKLVVWNDLN